MDSVFGETIAKFTREMAIEEGVLIDVTKTSREVGLKFPTALTSEVRDLYVNVPTGVRYQDPTGRLLDILWMLKVEILRRKENCSQLIFKLYVQNTNDQPELVSLKAIIGPGDNMEPVITIMLPLQD